jgi:hypothetical protein
MKAPPALPARVGPAELSQFGLMVAVRAPRELDTIFRNAGGAWEPGLRRWLIERRRIGPALRELQRCIDPLFRQAGISLDEPDGRRCRSAGEVS